MNALVNDTSTTSKRSIWPEDTRDLWVVGARESRLWLNNGMIYDDWGSALGANTLGYDFFDGWSFQPAASFPWLKERDFADEFCAAMDTEAVRFFKSGSDAVSCAVRLARRFANKSEIIVFDKSYHGTGDWFIPALWPPANTATERNSLQYHTYVLPFGQTIDEESIRINEVAAIVVEPVPKAIDLPPEGWLQHLRQVCDEHGILLISDEVILGMRHTIRGYMDSVGVQADLRCYGKAMGQGSAISACTGRMDIMNQLIDKVHFSGTANGEPLPLRIAQATLKEYLENDVCSMLAQKGQKFKQIFHNAGFTTKGLDERFEIEGCNMDSTKYCFNNGVLFPGFCSIAVSHTEEQALRLSHLLKEWRDG